MPKRRFVPEEDYELLKMIFGGIRQTSSKEKKSVSRFAFFFEALISEREEVVIGACEFAPPRV
jgi:hypothetical protein